MSNWVDYDGPIYFSFLCALYSNCAIYAERTYVSDTSVGGCSSYNHCRRNCGTVTLLKKGQNAANNSTVFRHFSASLKLLW